MGPSCLMLAAAAAERSGVSCCGGGCLFSSQSSGNVNWKRFQDYAVFPEAKNETMLFLSLAAAFAGRPFTGNSTTMDISLRHDKSWVLRGNSLQFPLFDHISPSLSLSLLCCKDFLFVKHPPSPRRFLRSSSTTSSEQLS